MAKPPLIIQPLIMGDLSDQMSYSEAKAFVEILKNVLMVTELVECIGSIEMTISLLTKATHLPFAIVQVK